MENCVFCKIIKGQLPSSRVYENDRVIAFKDIQPVAPVHVLIVPKTHIESVKEINEDNSQIIADIHIAANEVAKKMGVHEKGFRLINNCGTDGGQTVMHLHYHLIGGKGLGAKLI